MRSGADPPLRGDARRQLRAPEWLLAHPQGLSDIATPSHANASSAIRPFEDRFRVQLWDRPSTTVVSHIAKDGHDYVHPDPDQMRSMTVRDAARLHAFSDNYIFMRNRTHQYSQVGNAVPPLLVHQIAAIVGTIAKSL